MFTRLGRFIADHRKPTALGALAVLILAIVGLATVSPDLQSNGFLSEDAESVRVEQVLEEQYGHGTDSLILLFDTPTQVSDPATAATIQQAIAPYALDPRFGQVVDTWSTGNPALISESGTATYVVLLMAPGTNLDGTEVEDIEHDVAAIVEPQDIAVATAGSMALEHAISTKVETDLQRAETISIPLTLIIQIVVFGSLVAAGVPLLIGVVAIIVSVSAVFFLSTDMFQSIFAINIITMLGLGLGIDYSLFMVTRFREEIRTRSTRDAVAVTMATVGKAILFSGITVIFGLAATQFFDLPALQSMGQAGMIVTALALLFGLTLLPATLAMLGPRVNAISIGRRRGQVNEGAEGDFWHRLAHTVMRRPLAFLIPILVLLIGAGIPMLSLEMTPGGPDVLPEDSETRQATERLSTDFANNTSAAFPILFTVDDGNAASAQSVTDLQAYTIWLAGQEGVTGVASFLGDGSFDWATWNGDPATLPAPIAGAMQQTVRGDTVLLEVSTNLDDKPEEDLIRDIRENDPQGASIRVGGASAQSVDTLAAIGDGLLPAILFVGIGSYFILLFTFGSVFLPLKAIFMTLLSISASLGAVVFVFQDGNFENLLGFTATGQVISTTPILMFCILFGLSMDYEVLMLSRIQEEYQRTGDNRQSVAEGLAQTGKVITGAAAIMVVVFGGFIFAEISILKSIGFGLALAVLIDATIVRGLLVPATMRLMGRWNWWAPAPIKALVDRLGLSHTEPHQTHSTGD